MELVGMRRRDYLAALAGAGLLAGCSGNGSTAPAGETTTNDRSTAEATPTPDSTTTTTVTRTTATPRPTSAAVGENLQLFGGVTGTVTELVEANEVTLGGESKPHNDGEVWVLAHVQIHNQRSTSIPTPWAEDWALLTGSTQVKSYREEHYVAGELDGPVDGDWYEEADPAHAGVTTQGWLLFSVDRDVSTVEIAMEPPREWPIVASPSWAGQIDASAAPDISLSKIDVPEN